MAITATEHGDSGKITDGRSEELVYLIEGTTDNAAALAKLKEVAPGVRGSMVRDFCRVEPVANFPDTWLGYAPYIVQEYQFLPPQGAEEVRLQFEIGGGPVHFNNSLSQVAKYPNSEHVPDTQLVNANYLGEVKGVDIDLMSGLMLTYTSVVPGANINTYMGTLHTMRHVVNSVAWHGLAAGEAIFVGASGGERADGDYQITHRFAAKPNETVIPIGAFSVACDGWDYIDIRYCESVEGAGAYKVLIPTVMTVYVHRLFKREAFATAFGF